MGTRTLGAVVAAAMTVWACAAEASPTSMKTGGITTQPVGHYDFCLRHKAECGPIAGKRGPVELTRELWKAMVDINNAANAAIIPFTDSELWGVEEYWSYPANNVGDCEDYVIEKRRQLMAIGVPEAALPITVVRQPNGDGHAVLTVSTHLGDFILDNLEPHILPWYETDYQFLKRQSARNAGAWVSINDGRAVAVGSVR